MTVAELIAELQRMPQGQSVRVTLSSVLVNTEMGDFLQNLSDEDSEVADEVRPMGNHVLIRGR